METSLATTLLCPVNHVCGRATTVTSGCFTQRRFIRSTDSIEQVFMCAFKFLLAVSCVNHCKGRAEFTGFSSHMLLFCLKEVKSWSGDHCQVIWKIKKGPTASRSKRNVSDSRFQTNRRRPSLGSSLHTALKKNRGMFYVLYECSDILFTFIGFGCRFSTLG